MSAARRGLAELDRLDRATYETIAAASTPGIDRAMARLSGAADHSRISLAVAAGLVLLGDSSERRAAARGLTAIALTSALVNLVAKPLGRRRRPDRVGHRVVETRHVPMPRSRSFPSGHTAAAFAFAGAASRHLPSASVPLHALATAVGYSRVHTGVHYPGDVLAGATIGALVGRWVGRR